MKINLNEEELELVIDGLITRRCFIETRTATLTQEDLEKQGKQEQIQALNPEQMKLIIKLVDLTSKLQKVKYDER